jgi:hypothetical protein
MEAMVEFNQDSSRNRSSVMVDRVHSFVDFNLHLGLATMRCDG